MNCRKFFESIAGDAQYCKKLQQSPEDIQVAWEKESASEHSLLPAQDVEILARQVMDPTHYDNVTGNIAPTLFDDASSKGASCHRMGYITREKIREIAEARVSLVNQNPPSTGPRKAIGFTTLYVSEVRSVFSKTLPVRRAAGVYDTAKADDISHADICQLVSGKENGKSVRAQLFMLAMARLEVF
ncbi:MAG: hypothetical protein IPH35_01380 [Rhodoferax sp.]|nr:hypothetical protein [Rhodoferax sp.]